MGVHRRRGRRPGRLRTRFTLAAEPTATGAVWGCFAHLGRGVSSRPAIACSDGYTAFLRLLWAASGVPGHVPSRVSRSAPDRFETDVDPEARPLFPVHGT